MINNAGSLSIRAEFNINTVRTLSSTGRIENATGRLYLEVERMSKIRRYHCSACGNLTYYAEDTEDYDSCGAKGALRFDHCVSFAEAIG